jgi:sulfite exporter TauE/SafE
MLGGLVLFFLALVMATSTYQLLNAKAPVFRLDTCSAKGRMLCELGNRLSTAIPDPLQVQLELASGILLTMLALYGAVRLMWPRRANASSENLK